LGNNRETPLKWGEMFLLRVIKKWRVYFLKYMPQKGCFNKGKGCLLLNISRRAYDY